MRLLVVLLIAGIGLSIAPSASSCTVAQPHAAGVHYLFRVELANSTVLLADSGRDVGFDSYDTCVNTSSSHTQLPSPVPDFANGYLAIGEKLFDIAHHRIIVAEGGQALANGLLPRLEFAQGRVEIPESDRFAVEPYRLCATTTRTTVLVGDRWIAYRSAYGDGWFGHPLATDGLRGPWPSPNGTHASGLVGSLLSLGGPNGTALDLADGTLLQVQVSATPSANYKVTVTTGNPVSDPSWPSTTLRALPDPAIGVLDGGTGTSIEQSQPVLVPGTYTTTLRDVRYVVSGNQVVQHGPGAFSTTFAAQTESSDSSQASTDSHATTWLATGVGSVLLIGLAAIRRRLG